MKKLLLLCIVLLASIGLSHGHETAHSSRAAKGFTILSVNLITAQEIEIVCATKPASAQQVYDTFSVTVDGKKAD